jgi:TatA/E family protein of Tat protein translocase
MGPLGWQETLFIFVLALLIFGPKKLPELGKTIGKAMTEFRRASSELKSTFDREMASIERETESLKETTQQYTNEISGYQYDSYYDSGYYGEESHTTTANDTSHVGATATQGAESTNDTANAAEHTVAGNGNGTNPAAAEPHAPEKDHSGTQPVQS